MRKVFLKTLAAIFFIAIMSLPFAAQSQTSSIMYASSRNPLMNNANPAFFPSNSKLYFSLPGANVKFSSPLAFSSIFQYDSAENKTYINANNILDTLANGDKIRFGTNVNAFGFGINFGKFFVTLSSQVKVDVGFGMPSGLVTFLNEGNYGHTGDDVLELLDGNLINARVYAEGALGFGYKITDELTVGARLKMLLGYLDLSNAGSSMTLTTAPDYSSMTADLDINMNYAGCIDIQYDSVNDQTTYNIRTYTPKNYGFNIDLGAKYETDLFEVSASILDLGPGIHWTDSVSRIVSAKENNTFTFEGTDVSNMMHGGQLDSTYTQMLIDSLSSLAKTKTINGGEDYWTSIPTKVNLGGMFHITQGVSAGLLFHGEFERGLVKVGDVFKKKNVGFYSRTSLLARVNLYDWVELVASYSLTSSNGNWNFFNPGVGLTLTPFRTLQIYTFLDYISNIYIVDAKQLNISLGLNLFFGSHAD